jgi:hypothetical protein
MLARFSIAREVPASAWQAGTGASRRALVSSVVRLAGAGRGARRSTASLGDDLIPAREEAMANLNWSITLQVAGGPTISSGQSGLAIEAVDRVDVTIDGGDIDKVVQIQPGAAAHVHLLVVTSDLYGPKLSFKASDGGTDSAKVVLDGLRVYAGGAAALFATDPKQLKLTNAGTDSAHVTVFVARDATV